MRVAVITGGMGGLGESISTKMHAAGYRVVVTHSPGNTRVKDWLGEHNAAGRHSAPTGSTLRISTPARTASPA
jgi:acetoacetyl-CoA reductase